MKPNKTKLISADGELTAYAAKLLYRLHDKAATANGMSRYQKSYKDTIGVKVKELFYDLVFNKSVDPTDLSNFIKGIKVKTKEMQALSTNKIFISNPRK